MIDSVSEPFQEKCEGYINVKLRFHSQLVFLLYISMSNIVYLSSNKGFSVFASSCDMICSVKMVYNRYRPGIGPDTSALQKEGPTTRADTCVLSKSGCNR